jgi:hypothetical protein
MINKEMNNIKSKSQGNQGKKQPPTKPNEHGGFYFSSSVKIFDPNSKQVLVQKRGDA